MVEAAAWRAQARRRLTLETFDVVIVGGGITGAGIARDAALRGLRVALIEARDFASGTSSRSSRLVHGGVRYLEHGHLHLVFESSRERRILLRIAPHLVRPLAFTWPVYQGARISRLRLSLGLGLYDALAMFGNVARHERLSKRAVLTNEPRLRAEGLTGGARYFDASADDARLTLANVTSAVDTGVAIALNHAVVTGFETVSGIARGVRVRDSIDGDEFTVRATQVVNATGPWSDDVRAMEAPSSGSAVSGSRGAHIAVARERVGNRHAITMIHPVDGRVLFTLPAGEQAVIGTTETPTVAPERETRASREDVSYLLEAANHYFPSASLAPTDVLAAWSGIRPLARQLASGDVGSASREHTIQRGLKGVLHVTGGKLTTYREMASQVVDYVAGSGAPAGRTGIEPLPGGDRPLETVREEAHEVIDDVAVRDRLVSAYGSRWTEVWAFGANRPHLLERLDPAHPVIGAEFLFGIEREMAMTLGDLLIRRTHLAFEAADQARSMAPAVVDLVARSLGWDHAACEQALRDFEAELVRTFSLSD